MIQYITANPGLILLAYLAWSGFVATMTNYVWADDFAGNPGVLSDFTLAVLIICIAGLFVPAVLIGGGIYDAFHAIRRIIKKWSL